MADIYDRFRTTAARLLTRFDQGGTEAVVQAVVTNPDPLAPPAVNTTPQPVRAVVRGAVADAVRRHWPGPASSLAVVLRLAG